MHSSLQPAPLLSPAPSASSDALEDPAIDPGDRLDEPAWTDAAGERRAGGWDGRMTARLRALLHAGPLLRLKDREGGLPEGEEHYDLLALALAVFDAVIENTGLDGEADV